MRGFASPPPKPLFTFGIIADTHMRPEAGDDSSPWVVNKHANGRARHAIAALERAAPAFVVHLGDIVHPFPSLSTFDDACRAALDAHGAFDRPLRYIPGNHDVGDKKNPMMPADAVGEHGQEAYRRWFGADYQAFDHEGCRFVLVNAQLLNSGLADEDAQRAWLEAELAPGKHARVFLFLHYPPYVCDPDEPGTYDNLDEPGRSWLLDLIDKAGVEAVFSGHVHNFFYQRRAATEIYNLPATSFVRQDYAEMFRVAAAHEHGRDDAAKLGWALVDVFEDGRHAVRVFRSHGAELKPGEPLADAAPRLGPLSVKTAVASPLGVHLRHPWCERVALPYNGPMDEFHRKVARNDFTVMGLWECGIRALRVPVSDLIDPAIRQRMADLADLGHRFTLFQYGLPSPSVRDALVAHRALIDRLELVLKWDGAEAALASLGELRAALDRPVILANLESSAEQAHHGSKFAHFVSYGFTGKARALPGRLLERDGARAALDGFSHRVGPKDAVLTSLREIDTQARDWGLSALATIRLADDNPAAYPRNDAKIARRVVETALAASSLKATSVFLDTFMDLDRGYFPRHGLYDRRLNPRLAALCLMHLTDFLNRHPGPVAIEAVGDGVYDTRIGDAAFDLVLAPAPGAPGDWVDLATGALDGPASGKGPALRRR